MTGLLAGVASAVVAGAASAFLDFGRTDPRTAGLIQATLLTVGLALAVGCGLALRRAAPPSSLGHFLWADGRHLWQVTPDRVQFLPLDQLTDVTHLDGRVYLHTPAGREDVTLPSGYEAHNLEQFLQAVRQLREESKKSAVAADTVPELLGALALQVALLGPTRAQRIRMEDLKPGLPLPQPEEVATTSKPAPASSSGGRLLPWGLVVGAAALAFLTIPGWNESTREHRLYAATANVRPGEEEPFQRYLAAYPEGWRSEEVRARRDDVRYEQARVAAIYRQSPAPLRGYLTDQGNQRHRQEAEQIIAKQEQELFALATAATGLVPLDTYLKEFPSGGRIKEVLELRDDRVFALAVEKAKQKYDPTDLRAYLNDARHTRHRKEAETLIEDTVFAQAREEVQTRHRVGKVREYLASDRNQRHRAEAEKLLTACEEYLAKHLQGKNDRDLTGVDAYLGEFPRGAHAGTALELRDDRVFALAADRAKQTNDPADLRGYLKDARHTRHRQEAEELIEDTVFGRVRAEATRLQSPAPLRAYLRGGPAERHRAAAKEEIAKHYDAAIDRLRGTGKGKKVDAKLFQLLVALLNGLKSTDTPVVKVRFLGTSDPLPKTELQKAMEKFGHTQYEKKVQAIRTMAEQSPDKTAILPHGEAFSPEHTARRERLILELLRRALAHVLSEDLLKLEHAAAGEAAALEVAHHTYAGGMLYLFTTQRVPVGRGDDPLDPVDDNAFGVTVHGLLRGYEVNWDLKVLPADGGKDGHDYRFRSQAAQRLSYRRAPDDPPWAPTAVIMHSGSYEMSSRLIGKLGLPEPLTPRSFSFLDATDTLRTGVVVLSEEGVLKDREGEVAYEVRLEAGRTYRLDAESGAFDTFLRLDNPNGQTVASDDDSGGNLNARIVHSATQTGSYRVIVSCFDKRRAGRFLLTVQY